jgi:hypothetical protein
MLPMYRQNCWVGFVVLMEVQAPVEQSETVVKQLVEMGQGLAAVGSDQMDLQPPTQLFWVLLFLEMH